jgi:hypothetical protein
VPESRKRRTPYVPLDSFVAFKRTGQTLKDRWGMEGLCTWMLYLAACKRDITPGVFTYSSEEEAWTKLGARAFLFTIEEFFSATGRLRQTRRRRSGSITYVECRQWSEWNLTYRTQLERERQQHKRAQNPSKSEESKWDILQPKQKQNRSKSSKSSSVAKGSSKTAQKKKPDEHHLQRLLAVITDKDDGTEATLRSVASGFPPGALEAARERVTANGVKSRAKLAVQLFKRDREFRASYGMGVA